MKRTQIYLDEDILRYLQMESKIKHKRMSSLIRDILRKSISKKKLNLSAIESSFGIWKDRDFDVDKYIRNLRKGNRMKRLGYGK